MKRNRNILIYMILFALFINFFGRDILYFISSEVYGLSFQRLIPENSFYSASITELIVVFFAIYILYLAINTKYIEKKIYNDVVFNNKGKGKLLILGIISLFTLFYLYDLTHMVSSSERGVGQFNRSLLSSLMRVKIFIFPSVIFFLNMYELKRSDWLFLAVISTIVILSSILQGARRDAIMLILILLIYLMSYSKITYKKLLAGTSTMLTLVGVSMYFRMSDHYDINQLSFLIIFGILGGLGTNGILWQVKYYVSTTTGFLYGKTFFLYLVTLFVPSSFLYMFGDNEFIERSSYLFNDLYNTNENMGYDFMMIADFYWNFGYFGYLLFIVMTVYIIFFIKKNIYAESVIKRSTVFIIMIYFISGLRSDFGFFIKNVFYAVMYIYLLRYLVRIKKA